MSSGRTVTVLMVLAALFLGGCGLRLRYPDMGELYNKAAQTHGPDRNPIIVIPGILGTRLVEELPDGSDGRVVWGSFAGKTADPDRAEGMALLALPLRPEDPKPLVYPAGVLDRVKIRFLGIPVEMSAYLQILATLGVGGFRDQELGIEGAIDYGEGHYTCFQFPYDWRLSNAENARKLDEFIHEKRKYVQGELKARFGVEEAPVRFDVVAHSMGGLLLRYYLRYGTQPLPEGAALPKMTWAGAEHIERAILVAPPNGGSLMALQRLRNGVRFAPFLERYPAAQLGSYPSLYELLPRKRHGALVSKGDREELDPLDPQLWLDQKWGLVDPKQREVLARMLPSVSDGEERRRIAREALLRYLDQARRFQAALDIPASPPEGTALYLVAGDAVETPAVMELDQSTGALKIVDKDPGDGTVLRRSAQMDERAVEGWRPELVSPITWDNALFLFTNHLGLTKDPVFTDNVLYWLLEDRRGE